MVRPRARSIVSTRGEVHRHRISGVRTSTRPAAREVLGEPLRAARRDDEVQVVLEVLGKVLDGGDRVGQPHVPRADRGRERSSATPAGHPRADGGCRVVAPSRRPWVPSGSAAEWTWPIEAAASGTRSKREYRTSMGSPNSSSTTRSTRANEIWMCVLEALPALLGEHLGKESRARGDQLGQLHVGRPERLEGAPQSPPPPGSTAHP